jgi:hypothetical protein
MAKVCIFKSRGKGFVAGKAEAGKRQWDFFLA